MRLCLRCAHAFPGPTWQCPACGATPPAPRGIPLFAPELENETDGFEAEYFPELAAHESGNFWFESRNALVTWAVRCWCPNARSVLEVGCGTGFVLQALAQALPQATLYASEVLSPGLEIARRRVQRAEFLQIDARRLPFVDELDLVGAFDVIEHIEEDEAVLRSVHEALKPGGTFIATVPQHMWMWSAKDEIARHKRRYTRPELVGKLRRAGFEVLKATSFVSLLLPAMWASRKRPATDEFAIPARLNRLLSAVMAAELAAIRSGVGFPAGGSLLVVARKPG